MTSADAVVRGFALEAGPVPVSLAALGSRVLRITIGERAGHDAASYLAEPPPRPRAHDPMPGSLDTGALVARVTANPALLSIGDRSGRVWLRLALDELRLAPSPRLRLEIVGEQHFYGLGEGGAQFDRLGSVRRMWNYQVNRGQGADIAIPLLVSNAGYALFIDNAARGLFEPGDSNDGVWFEYGSEAVGGLDLYVLGGEGLRSVYADLAELLGRATMPPRWALGYMQSTRHFEGTEEVLGLASRFREKQIPCDALIFLSTYGVAQGLNRGVGHLEFHPELFAEPEATLGALRAQNFRLFSHEYPVLHPRSPLFEEAVREGHLLDAGYPEQATSSHNAVAYKEGQRFLDFSRPATRAWWWQHHAPVAACGIEGWWLDGGEGPPAEATLAAGPATVLHNRFDLLRQQAFAEGEAKDRPLTRPYLLCRSGGPGMQRFGAMPWSGDINTTFESLETQIRTGLNLAMSGVPHWGTDIGGFYDVAPDQGELFVRWLQFGAFCSIFRAHGHTWRRHVPWAHGAAIEAICRRIIELRYAMMPYTYTLAWQARQTGLPTMRPLVLNYPTDPRVWDLGTQFLWGDDLLVAPVLRRGATSWTVYLPEGTWHDFWTHDVHRGPRGVTVETPLDRLPLFVRGGAILPFGPVHQYAGERPLTELTLHVYPAVRSSFTLYEDDGETTRYLQGEHALTEITCAVEGSVVTCRVAAPGGDASVIPPGRRYTFRIRMAATPGRVEIDDLGPLSASPGPGDGADTDARWWMDPEGFVMVRLPPGPGAVRLEGQVVA